MPLQHPPFTPLTPFTTRAPERAGSSRPWLPVAVHARVLGAALGLSLVGCAVQAQTAPQAGSAAAARSFSIAAGPLAQVVSRYANAASLALSFDAAQLDGLHSPGLQGQYTVEAGFARLLEGTALRAVRESSGVYSLRATAEAAPAPGNAMATVTVSAAAVGSATTERSGSFTTSTATISKTAQSIRATPQPVTVLTRQFLDDRLLPDLHDVLQNTPGVTVDYVDSERLTYFSRGHQIDALQVDGLTMVQGGSAFVQPDTAVFDRVEVLRGASGMLRGTGSPSATVNMVRKRPTRQFQALANLTLGSWDRRRAELDLSGPLNEAGTLRGRVVAVADDKDFFQKIRQEERRVLYGVLEADLGADTTLTASLQHTDLNATGAWGNLPANFDGSSLELPRNTFLGAPWNQWNRHNQQAYAELEHRLGNDWKFNLKGSYTRLVLDDFIQSYFTRPTGATNPYLMTVTSSVYAGAASDQYALGATTNGPVTLFGRKHELLLGAESVRNRNVDSIGKGGLNPTTVDIRDWNPYSYAPPDVSVSGTLAPVDTRQQGVFATARLSVADPLTVILGARMSWWNTQSSANAANSYSVRRELTPYAGVVYDLSDNLSAYASYTEIFTPQNIKDINSRVLDPVRGEDFEAGLKGEFLDGRLNAAMSLFRINNVGKGVQDTSGPKPCPNNPTADAYCYVAGGKTRSQGWEMEVSGELVPGWQLMAGYTNTRTKYLRDSTASNVGLPLRSIDPRHMLRLFTSVRPGGMLRGWTFGGGAQIQSDSYVSSGQITARQGGYAIYNAMLGYRINDSYSVQVNINNLFDKVYYKKYAPTGIGNYYGDPRNVMVSLRASF